MNDQPRPFELYRLREAVRGHLQVLLALALVTLFGGAALGRALIPNERRADALVHIPREPHVVVTRALDADVLEQARRRVSAAGGLVKGDERVSVAFELPDRLHVHVLGASDRDVGALANALAARYVELARTRDEQSQAELRAAHDRELQQARAEHDRAASALTVALAGEGLSDLPAALAEQRARVADAEQKAAQAASALRVERARPQVRAVGMSAGEATRARGLGDAQRELSRLLAQHGGGHVEVVAQRARIERLQRQAVTRLGLEQGKRSDVRTLEMQARELDEALAEQRARLARLHDVSARLAPVLALEQGARAQLAELVGTRPTRERATQPLVASAARVSVVEPRALRLLVSVLAPVLALVALVGLLVLRALRGFRVCAATELAHWLGVPVITTSAWPRRQDALEGLIDELADPALDALGTTLLLPFSELERPLAATLAAKLNARAQRHYRSVTGSRITIAQDWQGELDSSRIKRAAEVADRVLWVVAADAHRGAKLADHRALVPRSGGVAAILVDGEPGFARTVGSVRGFWDARASELIGRAMAGTRLPLH